MRSKKELSTGVARLVFFYLSTPPDFFRLMVHYIALYRLERNKSEEDIEEMIRISRSCFHRVNEAHNFRSGRSIEGSNEFGFFISADFESQDKLGMFREDPNFHRFESEVVEAHTIEKRELLYETEPGKNPKYS